MTVLRLERPDAVTFDDFWTSYPRKVAKLDAQRAWAKLTQAQQRRAVQTLPAHVTAWVLAGRDKERIPHAATWLNGHRFEDELDTAPTSAAELVQRALG